MNLEGSTGRMTEIKANQGLPVLANKLELKKKKGESYFLI